MRKVVFALVLVTGILFVASYDVSVQALAFEEDPGPMNTEEHILD
ncbi:hypothetical protein [Virgibacillus halodenitrificans]|nr:hypothetical protein [Virgibacillus halodenitrificans]